MDGPARQPEMPTRRQWLRAGLRWGAAAAITGLGIVLATRPGRGSDRRPARCRGCRQATEQCRPETDCPAIDGKEQ